MILPAVRERLDAVLRHPSVEGALGALRDGAQHISLSGLHDVAKALVAAYLTHELRRPAFFVTDSNRRAEALAETVRFFSSVFPGLSGGVATLPAFDTLPWESQSPHPDILERRAATLFRLTDGQVSLVIAPVQAALWRYQDATVYLGLARTLTKDAEVPLEEFIAHLAGVGYTRTEMVELPGQFAMRGGIVDVFSAEALRPVRIELLGDTVESVREFDPRTQRSIAPVQRTTLLPLTEWNVAMLVGATQSAAPSWEATSFFGPSEHSGQSSLFELAESSLKPVVFLDEPQNLRDGAEKHLTQATAIYERHGSASAPSASHFFLNEEEFAGALAKTSQAHLEQLAVNIGSAPQFELSSRPSSLPWRCRRVHGRREVAARFGRQGVPHGGKHWRTRTPRGHLARIRCALRPR